MAKRPDTGQCYFQKLRHHSLAGQTETDSAWPAKLFQPFDDQKFVSAAVSGPALPNVKELSNAVDAVVDWRTLGIKLGLGSAELRRIEKDYPHDNAECKSEMLACCLQSDNPPDWKVVAGALCQMGEHRSAYKIRKKHLKPMKDTSNDEHKDDEEALPEHELRLRSAIVISQNYSILWQYLDPSQLLPKLIDKFLISDKIKEEAESYSQHAQTAIILRGLFDDCTPPNRLFKLADTLDTIPGQKHLGRKLLQDYKHLSTLSAHTPIPSVIATPHSDFSELSQLFQQLLHEALNLLDQFPNVVARLKQALAALVFPSATGKVVPLIDQHSYKNALTVRELFRILAPHWNPLSPDLLGLLLEASGCSMAVTKFAEFIDTRNSKGHLVLCVRQMPSLVDFRSVHSGPLSKLQTFHHPLFAHLPKCQATASQNTIRISVEVDKSSLHLSDYGRITTALSGLFRMPKLSLVFIGCTQSIISWQTFPEFSECSCHNVTDISGCRLLSQCRVTRIAVQDDFYQCPTIKEVELWEASCYGQLHKLIPLIKAGTTVNVATWVDVTPLYVACWKGHPNIVECLLRANAEVNLQTNNGQTALHVACAMGHAEVVNHLLTAKADVNLQRKDGYTALLLAVDLEHEDVVQLLIEVDADPDLLKDEETALMRAARWGSVGIVAKLIQHGANLNLTNKDGRTALHIAAACGHENVLQLLLDANMDPDIRDKDGKTALMGASYGGHPTVVRTLLRAGASVNSVTQSPLGGVTALMGASVQGHPSVVKILLQAGACVNSATQYGSTALLFAAQSQHEEIVKLLIEVDADPDLQNEDQETALMLAAREGNVGIVRMLIQHGANMNITNKDGLTACDLASFKGHPEVYQELVTHVSDQEENEDEPEPPQPFEWSEFCCSPIVVVPGQEEEGDEPEPPQPFEWTED